MNPQNDLIFKQNSDVYNYIQIEYIFNTLDLCVNVPLNSCDLEIV